MYDWSPALLNFYHNTFQMTLLDHSNLVKWGKLSEKFYYICKKAVGTVKYLLVRCRVLLISEYYLYPYDSVSTH